MMSYWHGHTRRTPPGSQPGGFRFKCEYGQQTPKARSACQSDRFIAAVKQSINKQLDLIDELKRAGGDAAKDEELLDTLVPMLRAMLDHRRAILKRLAPLSRTRLK